MIDEKKSHHHTTEAQTHIRLAKANVEDINRMLTENAPCTDVVSRISGVIQVLVECRSIIVSDHINSCISTSVPGAKDGLIQELNSLVRQLTNPSITRSHH